MKHFHILLFICTLLSWTRFSLQAAERLQFRIVMRPSTESAIAPPEASPANPDGAGDAVDGEPVLDFSALRSKVQGIHQATQAFDEKRHEVRDAFLALAAAQPITVDIDRVYELELAAMELQHLSRKLARAARSLQHFAQTLGDVHFDPAAATSAPPRPGYFGDLHDDLEREDSDADTEPRAPNPTGTSERHSGANGGLRINPNRDFQLRISDVLPLAKEIPKVSIYTGYLPASAKKAATVDAAANVGPIILCTNLGDYKYLKAFAAKMYSYLSNSNEAASCAKELSYMVFTLKQRLAPMKPFLPKSTELKCVYNSDYLLISSRFATLGSSLRRLSENSYSDFQAQRLDAKVKASLLFETLKKKPFALNITNTPINTPSPLPSCPPNTKKCPPPTRADAEQTAITVE